MRLPSRWTTAVALPILLGLPGCDDKVSECRRLIEVINREQDNLDALAAKTDAESRKQLADGLDAAAAKIRAVPLKLAPLAKLRDDYQRTSGDFAGALRTLADVQSAKEPEVAKVEEATARVIKAEEQRKKVTADINVVCPVK